jgi:hypothetical protein
MATSTVSIRVEVEDALAFRADVLALKYAQAHYGVDGAAYQALSRFRRNPRMPVIGQTATFDGPPVLGATRILFVGVPPLRDFSYAEIRDFGRLVLETTAAEEPDAEHVALTLHGPGFGLDETEAFESELAGVIEAIGARNFPRKLTTVTFVERDVGRANRLDAVLKRLLPTGQIHTDGQATISSLDAATQTTLRSAGYASSAKPRVFVAMPFAPEMDDTFHYGIQGATNAAGLLCERADLSAFTGDVMEWVKSRISSARLVVADLSAANPNVYLEVGYAWGKGVPTVLLAKDNNDLKFDVKTQRCIIYKSIKHLEESLARELIALA